MKSPEQYQYHDGVFMVNFEQISQLVENSLLSL